jgi:hypothetical protein
MKQILSGAAIALAFAVAASAQTTPPSSSQPTSQSTPSTTQKKAPHKKMAAKGSMVTLTGCLREGDTPGTFKLEKAEQAQGSQATSGSTTTGATATTGSGTSTGMSAGMATADLSNVNVVSGDIDLKQHVGHRVELRGMLTSGQPRPMTKDKGSSSTSDTMGSGSAASSSSATGTSGEKGAAANAQTLRVRSFRHVSDTCTQ